MMEEQKLINEALDIGRSFLEKRKISEAKIVLNQILKVDSSNTKALHLLGLASYAEKNYQKAKEIFLKLIEGDRFARREPPNPEYLNNLSLVYSSLGDFDIARNTLVLATKLDPENSNYHSNLGLCYRQMGKMSEALECFKTAIKLDEKNVYAWTNLGTAYGKTKDLDEAIRCLNHATGLDPNNKTIRVNLAYAYLLKGDMHNGWLEYENRWESFKQLEYFKKKYDQSKKWHGTEDLTDKTILVHCEQGAGDTIQFSRFLLKLKQKYPGCRILFQVPEEMVSLFKCDSWIVASAFENQYDYLCSVMSLPYLLKIDKIEPEDKYIEAPPANFNKYKQYFKVGIVWAGNPRHPNDSERSCNLSYFKRLQSNHIKLFSLQKDTSKRRYSFSESVIDLTEGCEDMSLVDMSPYLTDFQKTAMIIQSLDLVITVDTAILHLAGAIGRETWGLIPYNPDWRWGLTGNKTIWYPSVTLFRQSSPGNWESVFEEVRELLLK